MKDAKWTHRYQNEQNCIHMPDACREKILEQISDTAITENLEQESEYITAPRRLHIGVAIAVMVFLAGIGALFTTQLTQPASDPVAPKVQNLQIPSVTTEIQRSVSKIIQRTATVTQTTVKNTQTTAKVTQSFTKAAQDAASGTQNTMEIAPTDAETTKIATESVTESSANEITLSKEDLIYRCKNSYIFMNQISGSVEFRLNRDALSMGKSTFALDFAANRYYGVEDELESQQVSAENPITKTIYNDNGNVMELTDYHGKQENTYCNEFSICGDPIGLPNAALCYDPWWMTSDYLEDSEGWEMAGTQELQGRTCVVIRGSNPKNGEQFGVKDFEILVDQNTGVWMQFEGYGADGTVQSYIYTNNIRFDDMAEKVPQFTEHAAVGYTFIGDVSN